jgi:peroxiredoxin
VNGRESPDVVSAFMRENRLTFPTVLDGRGTITYRYGVQSIPTTYILDRQGMIVTRMVGSIEWNRPGIVAAIEALLQTN